MDLVKVGLLKILLNFLRLRPNIETVLEGRIQDYLLDFLSKLWFCFGVEWIYEANRGLLFVI